jgi:PHP family Zn ribbon phosphoesterase
MGKELLVGGARKIPISFLSVAELLHKNIKGIMHNTDTPSRNRVTKTGGELTRLPELTERRAPDMGGASAFPPYTGWHGQRFGLENFAKKAGVDIVNHLGDAM